jgi:hypothetical protein
MKYIFMSCLLIILFSCNTGKDQATATPSDTAVNSPDNYVPTEIVDKEKGRQDFSWGTISVKARYYATVADEEKDGNYIFIYNKTTGRTDSLKLESTDNMEGVKIEDLTDSLHFDQLSVLLTWTGDSDMDTHEFVQYGNTFRTVFTADNLVRLWKKDRFTLEGYSTGRDEIVYHSQDDYPVIISLKTGDVQHPLPPVQYIGAFTTALEDIKVSSSYTIKKGTELTVDTLYRVSNTVRLIISDSTIIHTKPETLEGKIEVNTAG